MIPAKRHTITIHSIKLFIYPAIRLVISLLMYVLGVGVARLLEDGSVQVDYLDSTALGIISTFC